MTPTILVVDDDPQVLGLILDFLSGKGYRVIPASSVTQGRDIIQREAPDLLLTDYRLPDGTGIEIVREAMEARPDLGAIVMTGVAVHDVQVAAEAIRSGALAYLTKPFPLEDLEAQVKRSLELRAEKKKRLREWMELEALPQGLLSSLERERYRLAMELHDGIGQALATLKLEVELLVADCRPEDAAMADELRRVAERLSSTMEQLSRISYGLRPANLDSLGLEPALRGFMEEANQGGQLKARLFTKGLDERCDPELELALYRIVQEGVTNALKHSSAKNLSVDIIRGRDTVSLVVEDDGRGFDPEDVRNPRNGPQRLGLLTMRERAARFGGRLFVDSRPGRGTCITAEIPLR